MKYISSLPEGLDAQVILKNFKETNKNFLFICRDDRRLEAVKAALLFFDPNLNFMTIPAWDCAPYETISQNHCAHESMQEDNFESRVASRTWERSLWGNSGTLYRHWPSIPVDTLCEVF